MKTVIQKIIDYGLLTILIIFPLSINVALYSPEDLGHPSIAINISLADLLIGLVLFIWIIKLLIFREFNQIQLPPFPILTFIGIGVLSFVNAFSISEWAKEIIQMIDYFFVFYMLLSNNLKGYKIGHFKNVLFISTSLILMLAFVQHTILNADPYLIRGLFDNHNTFGMFLCIAIPLGYMELLQTNNRKQKIWMISLLVLSILTVTSGSAVFSILISMFIVSRLHSKKMLTRFVFVILGGGLLFSFVMPKKNILAIKEFISIYEPGSISENYYKRLVLLEDAEKKLLMNTKINNKSIQISTNNYFSATFPTPYKGEQYKDMEGQRHIKNRYLEMQAAINIVSENYLLGIGLGNYQKNIGMSFNELPKINTAEPNQHNSYLVIAATTGMFGLAAFLWIFISLIKKLRNEFLASKRYKMLNIGFIGCLSAILIESFFTNVLVAGLMVPLVLILHLSYNDVNNNKLQY